ncbi:MAG TPA: MMPL family transporter, partial [Actinomycetota bacterium]|nr:MMPL family transporter [Actinomycetota bacterium]
MAAVEQEARVSLTPFLYRIGRGAVRHRWTVITVWVVVAVGLFVGSRLAGTAFIDDFRIPGAEAQAATDRLKERFPDRSGVTATVVFRAREGTLADAEQMAAIKATLLAIALHPHVVGIDDPTKEGGQAGVSADRTVAFTTVYYDGTISALGRPAADRLAEAARPAREAGLQVETGGPLVEYTHLPEIRASEVVGVVVAVVVLFVAFGSAVAMGV